MRLPNFPKLNDRRAFVLLAVLMVVVILSLAAYQYSDLMLSEFKASENSHRAAMARAAADSGLHYAAAMLMTPENITNQLNGNPWNNPDRFREVEVPDDDAKSFPRRFTLIAPLTADDTDISSGVRFGVSDEGAKININSMMKLDPSGKTLYDMLLKLPNMTDEVAASIVDWVDSDSTPRTGGAENEYYSAMAPPYRCKNGPLDSLEELLLVKGVTRELLFGSDFNRNGVQDREEDSTSFDLGWAAFLTVHSRESNRDSTGVALTFINDADLQTLHTTLLTEVGPELANYVILYRQYGPANSSGGTQSLGSALRSLFGGTTSGSSGSSSNKVVVGNLSSYSPDFNKSGRKKLSSLFDLANSQVSIADSKAKTTTVFSSPLRDSSTIRDLLPKLFNKFSLVQESEIPARINVTTAPADVLRTIPDFTETDVQNILSVRPKMSASEAPGEIFQTPAWLMTEANMQVTTLRKLEKYVTTRSQVYRVQSVGYFADGGPASRVEAVIDVTGGRPRFVIWRDLSELGKGWTPEGSR